MCNKSSVNLICMAQDNRFQYTHMRCRMVGSAACRVKTRMPCHVGGTLNQRMVKHGLHAKLGGNGIAE